MGVRLLEEGARLNISLHLIAYGRNVILSQYWQAGLIIHGIE